MVLPTPIRSSFLSRVDPAGREALSALGTMSKYSPRATLFHQGDPSRHVALLLEGWVKVTSVSNGGQEAMLALRGPGDVLGELAAIDGRRRSGTVTALVPVRATVIDGDRFIAAATGAPNLAHALLEHLASSLREADGKRLEYVGTDSLGRVVGFLLELSARHGSQTPDGILIDLPLSQRELATATATSREAVARTMRKLRDRDVVRTRRRGVLVVRPDILRSLRRTGSNDT